MSTVVLEIDRLGRTVCHVRMIGIVTKHQILNTLLIHSVDDLPFLWLGSTAQNGETRVYHT
jgi:hypothetical protein